MADSRSAVPYLERGIDTALLDSARRWLAAREPAHWISLASAPGRGNSRLVERFFQGLEVDVAFGSYEKLQAGPREAGPDSRSQPLGQLGLAVHARLCRLRLSRWRRVRRRLGNAGPLRLTLTAVVILLLALCLCLGRGLEEYATSTPPPEGSWTPWLERFWTEYLPAHWNHLPLWVLIGTLAAGSISTLIMWLGRRLLFPAPPAPAPTAEDVTRLWTVADLDAALAEICRRSRGAILVIDDAADLPPSEQVLLQQLFEARVVGAGAGRRGDAPRLLVVTVDLAGAPGTNPWRERLEAEARECLFVLPVPPFTPLELAEAWERRATVQGRSHPDGEVARRVEEAAGSIKALFADEDSEAIQKVRRRFQERETEGIAIVVDGARVTAYLAARLEPHWSKSAILGWLQGPALSEHCRAFGLTPPESPQRLVKRDLRRSGLVRPVGETYLFDLAGCRELSRWLSQTRPTLLAAAHYHWACHDLGRLDGSCDPETAPALGVGQRQILKRAARHLVSVSEVLDEAPEILGAASGLSPEERRLAAERAARALLAAAAIWREEGDPREADELVADALEWVPGLDDEARNELAVAAGEHLWRSYWLGAAPETLGKLTRLRGTHPFVADSPSWRLHRACLDFLEAQGPPFAVDLSEADLPASLQGRARLLGLWQWMRTQHGFEAEALGAPHLPAPTPSAGSGDPLAEFELRRLAVRSCLLRGDITALSLHLEEWRRRLDETAGSPDQLAARAVSALHRASFWHLLADASRRVVERLPQLSEEAGREHREELEEALRLLAPAAEDGAPVAPEAAWTEAKRAYAGSLHLASLLGLRPVALEASWGLGALLVAHTPADQWEAWDGLFRNAVTLEREIGWLLHQPEIHRLRLSAFQELDREASVEDAYNVLDSLRRARFPVRVELVWHRRVSGFLNDYGHTATDRRRSAELHERWARVLCPLPEAQPLRVYEQIESEQASSLHFAAQAHRHLAEYGQALALLDEAVGLLDRAEAEREEAAGSAAEAGTGAASGPGEGTAERASAAQRLRDLRHSLRLQRAWIVEAQGRAAIYASLIEDLWADSRPGDENTVLVLQSLSQIEARRGALADRWPPSAGAPPHLDPASAANSLPEEWFAASDPLVLANRFEFRFRQLLRLISPSRTASQSELLVAAMFNWKGMGKEFADAALSFGEWGLGNAHGPETRDSMLKVLAAVRMYFQRVNEINRGELEALRLLMHHSSAPEQFRFEYIRVLYESEALLRREVLVAAEGRLDWLAVARRVTRFLGVLTGPELEAEAMTLALAGSGLTPEEFLELVEARQAALRKGLEEFGNGEFQACLSTIDPVLPAPATTPWVRLDDLQLLDLWIRSARQCPHVPPAKVATARSHLRQLALAHVRQFGVAVSEEQTQTVVLRLIRDLDAVAENEVTKAVA